MTFYQELKEFFKTNDPHRLYMANKIARKFRLGTEQKVVMNRLKIVYDNGGPDNIVLNETISNETIVEAVNEEIAENIEETNIDSEGNIDIEIDIDIETPDDDK